MLSNYLIRNGLGYRAKDDHPLEVCLANPSLIKGAKCKIPLDICLENPDWLPFVGCSSKGYPLQVCLDYPQLLTSKACEGQLELLLSLLYASSQSCVAFASIYTNS